MSTRDRTIEDSTVEQVLHYVREGIMDGEFPPRSKLLPKAIAETCGTSFIPVREALRTLESESFVHFVHNRGAWVTPLSVADLEDLYSIRMELECQAVRQADRFTKEEIERLDHILVQSVAGNKRRQKAKLISLNRELHFSIYRKANSPRRIKMIEGLWMHSARYQRMSLDFRHDASDAEHSDIIAGLRHGDHEAAAEALRVHLQSTVDLIREDVESAQMQPTHGKKLAGA